MNRFAMEKMTPANQMAKSPRCPLRTLKECAEEHGLHPVVFGRLLKQEGGPAPSFVNTSSANRTVWYNPIEVRAWWAGLPPEAKKVKSGQTK